MKKLLGLLAVTPLAVTACGGGASAIDAKVERDNETKASTEVKAAFKALLTEATGKVYNSQDAANLQDLDGKAIDKTKFADYGLQEGNWYGETDSLFSDDDIDALTIGQAYRAALYFAIDTWAPYTNLSNQNGALMNGMLPSSVTYSQELTAAGYFPSEAKKVIDAVKEQNGDDGDYLLESYQNTGSRVTIAEYMQQNLAQVGVDVSLVSQDWAVHLENTQARKHGAYVGGWGTITGHAGYGLWGPFHSSAQGAGGNRQFVGNDTIDSALEAGQWSSTDIPSGGVENDSAAGKKYKEAQEEIGKIFATVPLYTGARRYLVNNLTSSKKIAEGVLQTSGAHNLGSINATGTYTIGTTGGFKSLHPHGSNDSSSTLINKTLYQSLWSQNIPAGKVEDSSFDNQLLKPGTVIDDATLIDSSNGSAVLPINPAAKWSDGSVVSAQEVVDSINGAAAATALAAVSTGVMGAVVENADTTAPSVRVYFGELLSGNDSQFDTDGNLDTDTFTARAFSAWKQTLAHAGFAIVKKDLDSHSESDNGNIIGTGQFKVKTINTSTKDVTLEKNDNFVANDGTAAATVSTLEFKVIADLTTATIAYEDGSIDFIEAITFEQYNDSTKGDRGSFATMTNSFIGFNLDQK